MSFNWEKKGLIFDPTGRFDWMNAYSQVPTVLDSGDYYRIYFTTRPLPDASGMFVSHTSFVDVDKSDPNKILYVHDKPVIPLGDKGTFDEFGVHPTSVLKIGEQVVLYYTGWARSGSVPYETFVGIAVSDDGGKSFSRYSRGPVVGKSMHDPFLANGAYVLKHEGKYVMVYASAKDWVPEHNKLEPVYTLKIAHSVDGFHWEISEGNILPEGMEHECISRPSVLFHDGKFHMWYGYRSIKDFRGGTLSYKIGYATSNDLTSWNREDEKAGIELSKEGWDSEMMSYPQVINAVDKLLMFYNGNFFGKFGFGYAVAGINN